METKHLRRRYLRRIHLLVWMTGWSTRRWEMSGGAERGEFSFTIYDRVTEDSLTVGLDDLDGLYTVRR